MLSVLITTTTIKQTKDRKKTGKCLEVVDMSVTLTMMMAA